MIEDNGDIRIIDERGEDYIYPDDKPYPCALFLGWFERFDTRGIIL